MSLPDPDEAKLQLTMKLPAQGFTVSMMLIYGLPHLYAASAVC